MKIYFEELCFQCVLGLQTVKFKLSNGSRCRKEDVMVLGNGVIIVIQDKDAYCHRQYIECVKEFLLTDTVSGETRIL